MKIEEEVQTGIAQVVADVPVGSADTVYDLVGRKVNPSSLRPGIYIMNGKKFILK